MTLYSRSLLNATVESPTFVVAPGERPVATSLARLQAQQGDCVTSRRHMLIRLQYLTRKIILHLDGQHDRSSLYDIVEQSVANGEFEIHVDGQPVPHIDRATVVFLVEEALKTLGSSALLVQ